jgi:polyketide biosynthesis acyl carrier protein
MEKQTVWHELKKHICDVLPSLSMRDIQYSDRLVDLGANSVDRVDIISLTLEGLDLPVPLHEVAMADNIGDLVELLHQKAQACPKR